jgi:hypothetical protein
MSSLALALAGGFSSAAAEDGSADTISGCDAAYLPKAAYEDCVEHQGYAGDRQGDDSSSADTADAGADVTQGDQYAGPVDHGPDSPDMDDSRSDGPDADNPSVGGAQDEAADDGNVDDSEDASPDDGGPDR